MDVVDGVLKVERDLAGLASQAHAASGRIALAVCACPTFHVDTRLLGKRPVVEAWQDPLRGSHAF